MGLLILGNSALITTITTVTATVTVTIIVTVSLAAISLAQQVILPNILKNLILGVWDSSDVGLNLGKLHNQIQTMEHSPLDFTAPGDSVSPSNSLDPPGLDPGKWCLEQAIQW